MSMLYDLMNEINTKVDRLINDEFREVSPQELGLDPRAGYHLFINEEYIAVGNGNRRSLDYYGGFEYVDEEHVTVLGEYIFYSDDCERIQRHLDNVFNPEKEEE